MSNLIIFGSSGAVGMQIIDLLNQKYVNYNKLKLIAGPSSSGKVVYVQNKDYVIERIGKYSFDNFDFAIFCVDSELSEKYAPYAIKSNCRVIDNSAAFRMISDIPLIVPEVNIDTCKNSEIIANPNCCTILLTMVLFPLHQINPISEVTVSTYQSASGAGIKGMEELISQIYDFANNKSKYDTEIFGRQYLCNVFSHNSTIDKESGYNNEEMKIIEETKKILNDQNLSITATCIRVPVIRSHCESVSITFTNPIDLESVKNILENFPGLTILDDQENNQFPEPIISSNKHEILVGRIRKRFGDTTSTKYELFLSGDQLLKGAALNALQIYKHLLTRD